jgi:hypothetical protein
MSRKEAEAVVAYLPILNSSLRLITFYPDSL